MSLMPPSERSSFSFSRAKLQAFLLGELLDGTVGDHLVHLLQALDRLLHRLEVGEHAAQPAVVDVGGAGTLRLFLDDVARLALGADEEDRAPCWT